jgi:hypothetical protein
MSTFKKGNFTAQHSSEIIHFYSYALVSSSSSLSFTTLPLYLDPDGIDIDGRPDEETRLEDRKEDQVPRETCNPARRLVETQKVALRDDVVGRGLPDLDVFRECVGDITVVVIASMNGGAQALD